MQKYLLNKAKLNKELGHIMLADLLKKWSLIDDTARLKYLAEWHLDRLGNYHFAKLCMLDIISQLAK